MAIADAGVEHTPPPKAFQPRRRPWLARLDRSLAVPVASALLTFVFVLAALGERGETVAVATAAVDIQAGRPVEASHLRVIRVAKGAVTDRLLGADAIDARRLTAVVAVKAGDPLRASDVIDSSAYKGLLVMGIPLTAENAAGGEFVAGDRVDLIDTVDGKPAWVARKLEVVAVERRGSGFGADLGSRDALLLRVDADQALAVARAKADGKFDIVLSTGAAETAPPNPGPPSGA